MIFSAIFAISAVNYFKFTLPSAKFMQNPLKMNSFCYRKIPKPLEWAIMKLDSALKPLNTIKIEYVMRRHAASGKHDTPEPASPLNKPV